MQNQPIVVGVLTTFHPTRELLSKVNKLSEQCCKVIVVDDTGLVESDFYNENMQFFNERQNFYYLTNTSNLGIAFSLNRGIKLALEVGADFIVTFDDDTEFSPDYNERCLSFLSGEHEFQVGGVSLSRGKEFSSLDNSFRQKRLLITSGFFCSASIYKSLVSFPEEYFIDLVDFYLSLKIRSAGYKLIELSSIGMIHKVGNLRNLDLPIQINVFNHSPFRLYYQVRNSIPFFCEFWRFDFILCSYLLLDIFRLPFKAILFEDKKLVRLKYCFKGLWHGIHGKMGRLNDKN